MRQEEMEKLEQQLRALRDSDDPALHDRIARQHPADWDMEAVFQESMHRAENAPSAAPAARKRLYCYAGLAACLALTLGLTHQVWSRQQHIEMLPPEHTTACVTQTVPTAPAVQTTMTTTTAKPAPAASASFTPQTTAALTTAMTTPTDPAEQVTQPQTVPSETEPVIAEAVPVIEETEPFIPETEPLIPETEPPVMETQPIPPETVPLPAETDTPAEEAPVQVLEGYSIQQFGARAKVTYMGEPPVHEETEEDLLHIRGIYSLQSMEQSMTIMVFTPEDRFFCDLPEDAGSFAFWCDAGAELIAAQVCGDPAVFVVTEEQSTLYWSDGTFTFWVVSDTKNREELLETASVFMQLYAS